MEKFVNLRELQELIDKLYDDDKPSVNESVLDEKSTINAQPQNSPKPLTTADKIVELLNKNPKGLKAWQIGQELGIPKREANSILYKNHDMFVSDSHIWKNKSN